MFYYAKFALFRWHFIELLHLAGICVIIKCGFGRVNLKSINSTTQKILISRESYDPHIFTQPELHRNWFWGHKQVIRMIRINNGVKVSSKYHQVIWTHLRLLFSTWTRKKVHKQGFRQWGKQCKFSTLYLFRSCHLILRPNLGVWIINLAYVGFIATEQKELPWKLKGFLQRVNVNKVRVPLVCFINEVESHHWICGPSLCVSSCNKDFVWFETGNESLLYALV